MDDQVTPEANPPSQSPPPVSPPPPSITPVQPVTPPTPPPVRQPGPSSPVMVDVVAPPPTAAVATEEPARVGIKRRLLGGLAFLLSWVVFPLTAVLVLHFFVFQAYHVDGTSMLPNLHNADYLVVSKLDYTTALLERDLLHRQDTYIPHRGQIIVFHYPKEPQLIFVKRVVGLPGDRVVITGGHVTIYNPEHPNGFDPNTGYEAKGTVTLGNINLPIPAGQVFVLGDNRTPGGSFDSRAWGTVSSSYIIGNAVLRLLPLDQLRTL